MPFNRPENCRALRVLRDSNPIGRSWPFGLFGGEPGALAETVLNPDGNGEKLGSKEIRELKRGDVLSIRLSGAGGCGSCQ